MSQLRYLDLVILLVLGCALMFRSEIRDWWFRRRFFGAERRKLDHLQRWWWNEHGEEPGEREAREFLRKDWQRSHRH